MHKDSVTILHQLVAMSHELGRPEYDLAILGEGNSSALLADGTFLVKASGCTLRDIDEQGLVTMDRAATERLLDSTLHSDTEITAAMQNVCIGNSLRRPSVEAMMHAYLLGLPEIRYVGHTHPTPVNALLCSTRAEELAHYCLFPDQIVCCGPSPVFIPYTDPGLPLARMVRSRVQEWMQTNGMTPRALLIQNHGLFALGKTPNEVLSCSLMWRKTARVMLGTLACGDINPLTKAQIERIFTRPDEKYREQVLAGNA